MKVIFIGLMVFLVNPTFVYSQEMSEKDQESKEEVQGRRRKKVMMCHECGKPETECDCEGEGHGVHDEGGESGDT